MKMGKFKRKNNYSNETIKEVKELIDAGILMIPGSNEFKGYEKGLVIISKLTDSVLNIIGDEKSIINYQERYLSKGDGLYEILEDLKKGPKDKKIFFNDNKEKLREIVQKGMSNDRERLTSQIISLNNMSFDDDKYSVCGWEVSFPQNYLILPKKDSTDKLKKPEIDIIVVNPDRKEMILVEYKCKGDSMIKGDQNIAQHCIDYMQILYSNNMSEIRDEMLKAYNVYRKAYGKSEIDCKDFSSYKVKVGFLLVDEIYVDGVLDSGISESDYEDAVELLNDSCQYLGDNIVYIRKKTIEEVDFKNWEKIRDSGLKLTE